MSAAEVKGARCSIALLTEAGGAKAVLVRLGEMQMEEGGGVTLSYEGENGSGMLTVEKTRATWRRGGEMNAELVFEVGEITQGTFGSDGLNGTAQIETHKIELKIKKDVVSAEIAYTLKFDYGEQKTKVKIRARLLEETAIYAS